MLKDTKLRVILLTVFVMVIIIGIFIYFNVKNDKATNVSKVALRGTPTVTSIPGSKEATAAYREAVEKENIQRAEEAARSNKSAVPTLTQPTYQNTQSFSKSNSQNLAPGCHPDDLRKAKGAGVRPEELRCKGCTVEQLSAAGYTAGELKSAGFTADQLKPAGFTANTLRNAGFSADELKKAGFPNAELKAAGYNAKSLRQAGVNPDELRQAGFTEAQVAEAQRNQLSDLSGYSANFPKDCSPEALKAAATHNILPEQIRQALNCDVKSLKDAGYTAAQLKKGGFTAGELKEAGFSPKELKGGGYSAPELREAGYPAAQLKEGGFQPDELKNAGYSRGELLRAGFLPEQLKEAGASSLSTNFPLDCTPEALKRAYMANIPISEVRRALGCNVASLRQAGYSPKQLKDGGFTADELTRGGISPQDLQAADLTSTSVDPAILKQPGFPKDCSVESLSNAKAFDISVSQIRQALKCDAAALKAAGYTASELMKAGVSPEVLKRIGFNAAQLKAAGAHQDELLKAGFSPQEVQETSNLLGDASDLAGQLPSIPPDRQAQFLSDLRKRQAEQLSDQQRQVAMQQIQQAMATQASDLLASWTPPPTQSFVLVQEEKNAANKKGATGSDISGFEGGLPGERSAKGSVIKAGTVLFGVLDTGINSDQDSPILATIIQGELKGARLVGSFSRKDERVLVTFRTISLPSIKNSLGINAVAIDPDEARTALASRVDNHYFLRYGTLFASSFLSGLSSAITQSGSTVSTNANTGIVVQNTPKLDTGQKALVALGNVGQQYASVLGKNFTIPPTVTVDAGIGIGVLLMQDLTIPENEKELDILLSKELQKEKEQKREERLEAMERADMLRRGYKEQQKQL